MVVVATLAAIIGSQSMISGAFSVAQQVGHPSAVCKWGALRGPWAAPSAPMRDVPLPTRPLSPPATIRC